MRAEIIIKNEKGQVMQKVLVSSNAKAEVRWDLPTVDGDFGYGGFDFEFIDVHRLEK